MKIAFLLTQSMDSPGGAGRFGPLARELANLGHQVSIYALNPDPKGINPDWRTEPVDIRYVGPMHVIKSGSQKTYYPVHRLIPVIFKSTWGLSKAALASRADIIYVCKAQPMNGIAGILARYLRGRLLCVDCDDYEVASGNFSNSWQKSLVAFFERLIPRHAHLVTTNTYFMKNKLVEWGVPENKIEYLPNGVDLSRFQSPDLEKLETLRIKYRLENKRVIAYIGSISLANHPIELLMNAFEKVHAKIPDSVLLLVGGGESLEAVQNRTKSLVSGDHVLFTGKVPQEDVVLYYRLAHVTVDPVFDNEVAQSRAPLKLFESLAAGIPFVTADVGDRRLLLGDPPAGLLTQPGDPASLADCLVELLQNPSLRSELQARGLKRIQDFTIKKIGYHLASAFEQKLVAAGSNRG